MAIGLTALMVTAVVATYVHIRPGPNPIDHLGFVVIGPDTNSSFFRAVTVFGTPGPSSSDRPPRPSSPGSAADGTTGGPGLPRRPLAAAIVNELFFKPAVGRMYIGELSFASGSTVVVAGVSTAWVLAVPRPWRVVTATAGTLAVVTMVFAVVAGYGTTPPMRWPGRSSRSVWWCGRRRGARCLTLSRRRQASRTIPGQPGPWPPDSAAPDVSPEVRARKAVAATPPPGHLEGRVVLLAGPGESTDVVANFLASRVPELVVIMEDPPSRRRMAVRRAHKLGWPAVIGQLLFIAVATPILRHKGTGRVDEILRAASVDATPREPDHRVRSINDADVIGLLTSLRPAVVVVNGTRIIAKPVLESAGCPVINLHAGITPRYRGVHGGYWALAERHPEWIGKHGASGG